MAATGHTGRSTGRASSHQPRAASRTTAVSGLRGTPAAFMAAARLLAKPLDRFQADVAKLAALRALAHVLGKLLRIERLDGTLLPALARDRERLAVGERHRPQGDALRERHQLHAHAAVRAHRDLVEREEKQ